MIDNGAHHIDHLVAASLRNHLVHARCELCNHISFAVFDTTDEGRGAADALIDEGGVGRGHFSHGDLAWAEAECHGGVNVGIGNTKVLHQALQSATAGVNLTHEVGRCPVARLRKSPNEGYHLPGSCAVGIARCPKRSAHAISTLCIQHERFGCVAVFKRHDVDKGFHCRTDLSSTGHGHIILEMGIIETAHIGFDKPVARIDRHEPGTQNAL